MTMPDLWTLASAPAVDLLGWTLLHFVWQGALLAAVLAGALRLLQNHTPQVRYGVSCVALFGLLAMPVGTGLLLSGSEPAEAIDPVPATVMEAGDPPVRLGLAQETSTAQAGSSWREQATTWLQPALPWLVLGWSLGVITFAGRLAGGAWRVRRLRRSSRPVPSEWKERLRALAEQMGLRGSVALRRSGRVESPVVAGWWQPVVLLPAGLLSGLPPKQVEALLLHELAHIRRHDVLVGRLQAVVEVLLFFHPATWWISTKVRRAREACCDDRAVQAGTDRTVYARALAAMAERVMKGSPGAWAPAASDGALLTRIRRLLSPPETPSTHTQRLSMIAAGLLLLGVPLGLAACASQQTTSDTDSVQAVPAASDASSARVQSDQVIVLRDDSTGRTIRVESDGPVQVDSLGDDAYVLRYDGRVDTLDLPDLPTLPDLPDLSRLSDLDPAFDADSLERILRRRFNPDSMERVLRARINPDSIERAVRMQLDADSLARWHREHADSLRRHFEGQRHRMEREMPERLREQARRLREQADRLEERAKEMDTPPSPEDPTSPSDTAETSAAASWGPAGSIGTGTVTISARQYAQ